MIFPWTLVHPYELFSKSQFWTISRRLASQEKQLLRKGEKSMTILYLCNFDLSPFFPTVTDIRVRNPLVVEVLSVFISISIFERKRKNYFWTWNMDILNGKSTEQMFVCFHYWTFSQNKNVFKKRKYLLTLVIVWSFFISFFLFQNWTFIDIWIKQKVLTVT